VSPGLAHRSAGAGRVRPVLGHLQPLAVTGPTQTTVRHYDHERSVPRSRGMARLGPGGRPSLYADPTAAVAQTTGQPPVQTEQLARLTWKKALTAACRQPGVLRRSRRGDRAGHEDLHRLPHQPDCRQFALAAGGELQGIWGRTSALERLKAPPGYAHD
jgi:hypothetical protein